MSAFCNDMPKYFWQIVVQHEIVSSNFPVYGRWFYHQVPILHLPFSAFKDQHKNPRLYFPPFFAIYYSKCLYFTFWEKKKKVNISSDILYLKVVLLFLKKQKSAHSPLLKEMEYWVFWSSLLEESDLKINLANWI